MKQSLFLVVTFVICLSSSSYAAISKRVEKEKVKSEEPVEEGKSEGKKRRSLSDPERIAARKARIAKLLEEMHNMINCIEIEKPPAPWSNLRKCLSK